MLLEGVSEAGQRVGLDPRVGGVDESSPGQIKAEHHEVEGAVPSGEPVGAVPVDHGADPAILVEEEVARGEVAVDQVSAGDHVGLLGGFLDLSEQPSGPPVVGGPGVVAEQVGSAVPEVQVHGGSVRSVGEKLSEALTEPDDRVHHDQIDPRRQVSRLRSCTSTVPLSAAMISW
jgi:hypothetical protein